MPHIVCLGPPIRTTNQARRTEHVKSKEYMQDLEKSCRSKIIITLTLAGNWRLILPLIQFTPLASSTWSEQPLSTLLGIAFILHAAINISSHTGAKKGGKMWRMDVLSNNPRFFNAPFGRYFASLHSLVRQSIPRNIQPHSFESTI